MKRQVLVLITCDLCSCSDGVLKRGESALIYDLRGELYKGIGIVLEPT